MGRVGTSWDKLGRVGMSWEPKKLQNFDIIGQVGTIWDELGQVGTSWNELGWVGNQRNYRILTLKKTSGERRKKERRRI